MDVLGHWELTLIQRWRAEGMVVFLLFFIYFARLGVFNTLIFNGKSVRFQQGIKVLFANWPF